MRTRLLVLTAVLLAIAAPALAHVKVSPEEAQRGTTATFTFTVPNEEDNASTTLVEVYLPPGVERDSLSAQPPAGWSHVVTESPGSVRFTGGKLSGEDEADFKVTLAVPSTGADELVFKVTQSYDNGEVVRWIDTQTGSEEPEHPAPVVKLTGTAATTPATTPPAALDDDEEDDEDDDSPALVIVLGALLLAGIGAGIAIAARRRRSV